MSEREHDGWDDAGDAFAVSERVAPPSHRVVEAAYDPFSDGPVDARVDPVTGWPPESSIERDESREVRTFDDPFVLGVPVNPEPVGRSPKPLAGKSFDELFESKVSWRGVLSFLPSLDEVRSLDSNAMKAIAPGVLACVGLALVVVFIGPWCNGLAIIAGVATAVGVFVSYTRGTREFATIIAALSLMAVLARHAPWLVVPFTLVVAWLVAPDSGSVE